MEKNEGVPNYIISMKGDYDYVRWVGIYKKKNVYECCYEEDKYGEVPTSGFPYLIIDSEEGVEIVDDDKSLDILEWIDRKKDDWNRIKKELTPYDDGVMMDYVNDEIRDSLRKNNLL